MTCDPLPNICLLCVLYAPAFRSRDSDAVVDICLLLTLRLGEPTSTDSIIQSSVDFDVV